MASLIGVLFGVGAHPVAQSKNGAAVAQAPAPRSSRAAQRGRGDSVAPRLAYANGLRSVYFVMRNWRPREIAPGAARQSWRARLSRAAIGFFDRIADWQERASSRRELLRLDDHALRDIGIDRATARHSGGLPFWRKPM